MAITNYGELRAAVLALTDRGSDVEPYIPDFVTLAEDTIFNGSETVKDPLRVRQMMAVQDLTPVDGVCTLPDDYLQYRRVVEKASIRRPLQFVTPDYADQEYPTRSGGLACDFTIVGDGLYMFPVSSNDIELTYYQRAPALDSGDDASVNWLLTKHPFLYLHAVAFQLAIFVKDTTLAAQESGVVSQTISTLNTSSQNSEFANAAYRPRGFFP
jgi:hypothetical protein